MGDELNKINVVVENHIGNPLQPDKTHSDHSVRLGLHLEENHLTKNQFFTGDEVTDLETDDAIKFELTQQICKRLLFLVQMANKEQILLSEFVLYMSSNNKLEKGVLQSDICEKFSIKHISTFQENEIADFELSFEPIGKLAEVFETHQVRPIFYVSLTNKKGKIFTLIDSESELSRFYKPLFTKDIISLKTVQSFLNDIEKFFVMFALKMN